MFGNAGSIVSCRAGAEDAAVLSKQIGLGGPDALLDLPNFTAWARLLRRGVPTSPIRIDLDLEKGVPAWVQPWRTKRRTALGLLPANLATGRTYSGINIPILWHAAKSAGYPDSA